MGATVAVAVVEFQFQTVECVKCQNRKSIAPIEMNKLTARVEL